MSDYFLLLFICIHIKVALTLHAPKFSNSNLKKIQTNVCIIALKELKYYHEENTAL